MIKCKLIDIGTDKRATICMGEGPRGKVVTTPPITWINNYTKEFLVKEKRYDFSGPMLP